MYEIRLDFVLVWILKLSETGRANLNWLDHPIVKSS